MKMPTFNDGCFVLYRITESEEVTTERKLSLDSELKDKKVWFEELSVSDRLKSQLNSSDVDITLKIRIPQYKRINSMCVLKIGLKFHKVYNIYHFADNDGFKLSDITLTNWEGDYEEVGNG